MPRSNIDLYWEKAEMAPEGVIAQVLVTDGGGADYLLPYPCKFTKDGWVNAATGLPLAAMMPLKDGYRGSTTPAVTVTKAGRGASTSS